MHTWEPLSDSLAAPTGETYQYKDYGVSYCERLDPCDWLNFTQSARTAPQGSPLYAVSDDAQSPCRAA